MSQSRPTVVVIGAGPAALAALHRVLAEPGVRPVLVAPGGRSGYLPGALAVATGDASIERYRARVEVSGVEVVPAAADAIEAGRVHVAGRWIDAQAIIAAPGLTLTPGGPRRTQAGQGMAAFWDLEGAARVAGVIGAFDRGLVNVVIASALYRCPPAPYGLAIRLARRATQLDLPVRVALTTPEPQPLAAIGSQVSKFLRDACADAGVEIFFDTHVDQLAYADGELRDDAGSALPGDLTVVIPPHTAHPLLAMLTETGPLVDVDEHGRTAIGGVYAAGDAVKSAYPRATAPAALSGLVAADGALADLGFKQAPVPATPEPDCFIDQGAGRYSRLQLSYPSGPPPAGSAAVTIGAPALAGLGGFDAALERWRASCAGLQK
jgi:sulfide:quinone oxidoreductase